MKTIILPGYSPRNRDWALEIKGGLDLGHEVIVHEWSHWDKVKSSSFSLRNELDSILKKVKDEKKINIIAKSVGTKVIMRLICKVPNFTEKIKKLILCGVPTKFASETPRKLYKEGLSPLSPAQVIVIQNTKDPLANFSVVNKFINSVNPKIKVIEKPRSDHHYPYTEDFQNFLK